MKSANEGITQRRPREPHVDDFAIGGAAQAPPPGRPPAPPAPPRGPRHDPEAEVDAVATWFARIGAGALVLAMAFAYSYAVDRGLITPTMRVFLGAMLGAGMLVAGEWTRRREWPAFAQAVTGAGIGVGYLLTWAAYERYGLISGPAAFVVLALVSAAAVGLAWRHDSEVLAGFGVAGAFLVPALVSNAVDPLPVLGYVLLVDVAILATVTARPWRVVGRMAFLGTWIFAQLSVPAAGPGPSVAYGALFWAVFAGHPVIRAALGRRAQAEEAAFSASNAFAFWTFAMLATHGTELEAIRGALTAAMGATYLGLWAAARGFRESGTALQTVFVALGGGFLALAVPIQLEGPAIAAAWTVQSVALVAIGTRTPSRAARVAGLALLCAGLFQSVLVEFRLGLTFTANPPVVSGNSLVLLMQVLALHAVSGLLRQTDDPARAQESEAASVGGHLLALLWGAFEAGTFWQGTPGSSAAIYYTLTVEWSLYAAGLMTAGILMRRRRARLVALGLFVLTIGKVLVVDLWTLSAPHRVIAFGALGLMLLGASLLYHRFRALILEAGA